MPPTSFQPTEKTSPSATGEDRRAERREDVVAVVPVAGDVAAEGAEGVAVRRRAVDREDVAAGGQPRLQAGRRLRSSGGELRPFFVGSGATRRLFPLRVLGAASARPARGRSAPAGGATLGLHVRLRVADLDLRAGRQHAVRRGQVDGERGHEAVEALRAAGARARVGALLERDEVAPVAKRHAAVGRDRRAEPSTVSEEIVAPAKSPLAARPRVEPCAAPLIMAAVISPPKRLSDCTSLVAAAVPAVPESLEAEALMEPVLTTEPSVG